MRKIIITLAVLALSCDPPPPECDDALPSAECLAWMRATDPAFDSAFVADSTVHALADSVLGTVLTPFSDGWRWHEEPDEWGEPAFSSAMSDWSKLTPPHGETQCYMSFGDRDEMSVTCMGDLFETGADIPEWRTRTPTLLRMRTHSVGRVPARLEADAVAWRIVNGMISIRVEDPEPVLDAMVSADVVEALIPTDGGLVRTGWIMRGFADAVKAMENSP